MTRKSLSSPKSFPFVVRRERLNFGLFKILFVEALLCVVLSLVVGDDCGYSVVVKGFPIWVAVEWVRTPAFLSSKTPRWRGIFWGCSLVLGTHFVMQCFQEKGPLADVFITPAWVALGLSCLYQGIALCKVHSPRTAWARWLAFWGGLFGLIFAVMKIGVWVDGVFSGLIPPGLIHPLVAATLVYGFWLVRFVSSPDSSKTIIEKILLFTCSSFMFYVLSVFMSAMISFSFGHF